MANSYSEREILLELFPATPEELIPKYKQFKIKQSSLSQREILVNNKSVLELFAIPASGNPDTQISCDLCNTSAARKFFKTFKIEKPSSDGRVFRYYWMCANLNSCKHRGINEARLEQILINLGVI